MERMLRVVLLAAFGGAMLAVVAFGGWALFMGGGVGPSGMPLPGLATHSP
jgi:hypothetical protein